MGVDKQQGDAIQIQADSDTAFVADSTTYQACGNRILGSPWI
jgi:hypothetical protein